MRKPILRVIAFGFVLCLAFGSAATSAMAEIPAVVPRHVIVGAVDLIGMTEPDARAAISAEASLTSLPPLRVTCAGFKFSIAPSKVLTLNVDAMVASAFATQSVEPTITLTRVCTPSSRPIASFVASIAKKVNRSTRSASYYTSKGHLRWKKAITGRNVKLSTSRATVTKALLANAAAGTTNPRLTLAYKKHTPKVTNAKLGRAILVDISQRKLRLYDHSKLLRTYGIAVGMPGHETPRGTFKVVGKSASPTWRNPGSPWAGNMPSYIAPGPNNPLGLRALYINSPGIRIHGTSNTGSIGTASSHGCMRVANANIVKLYPLVPVGTKVFIIK